MNYEPVDQETDQKLRDTGHTSVPGNDNKYVGLNEYGNPVYVWVSGNTIQTQQSSTWEKLD